jgi:integrase
MLLKDVLILASTGMKVGGVRRLKWRDLREIAPPVGTDQQPDVALFVKGKTGPPQVVSKNGDDKIYLKRILDLRMNEMGSRPSGDDYVFASPEGKPIGSFKKSFASSLKPAGVEKGFHINRRAIFLRRHTYAPFRIQEGVRQYILALNMDMSTAMLEKHYGHMSHVVSAAERSQRTGGSNARKVGTVDWLMKCGRNQ